MRTRNAARRRTRCRRRWASFALAGSASRGDRPHRAEGCAEAERRLHRHARGRRQDDRRLPEGAEPDPAGEERAHLGHDLVRRALRRCCGSSRAPASRRAWTRGASGSATTSSGRQREVAKPRPCSRSTGRSSPTHERVRPASSRRPGNRPTRCGASTSAARRPSSRRMRERAAGRRRGGQGASRRRPARARSLRWPSMRPRSSCSTTSTRARRATRRELHQPGRERTDGDERRRDRIDGVRGRALFEVARAEGHLGEVEDELFRFARTSRAPTSCATRSPTAHPRESPRSRSSRTCWAARPRTSPRRSCRCVVGRGPRSRPPGDHRLARRARRAEHRRRPSPRCARPIALTEDQRARLAEAIEKATGKSVEVKSSSIRRCSVVSSPTVGDTVIDGSVRTASNNSRHALGDAEATDG